MRLVVVTSGQLRAKQMAPQLPVELHAKIGLAQRYKTRYVDDQVGMEILNIQPIEEKQPPHEQGTRGARSRAHGRRRARPPRCPHGAYMSASSSSRHLETA